MDLAAVEAEVARWFPALAADSSGLEFSACVLSDICMAGDHVTPSEVASVLMPMLEDADEAAMLPACTELLSCLAAMPGADVAVTKPAVVSDGAALPPAAASGARVAAASQCEREAGSGAGSAAEPRLGAGASAAAAGGAAGDAQEEAASAGAAMASDAAASSATSASRPSLGFPPAMARELSVAEFRTPVLEEEVELASAVCSAGDVVMDRYQDDFTIEFPLKVFVSRHPPGEERDPSAKPVKKPVRTHAAVASLVLNPSAPPIHRGQADKCHFTLRRHLRVTVNGKVRMSNVEASAALLALAGSESARRAQRAVDREASSIRPQVAERLLTSGSSGWLAEVVMLLQGRMQRRKDSLIAKATAEDTAMRRGWGAGPRITAPPLTVQAAQVPTAHERLHFSEGAAGFGFGGTSFVHGGAALYIMGSRLLHMDSVTALTGCISALKDLCLPHGGIVPVARLPWAEPFGKMLAHGITFRQVISPDGRCIDQRALDRVFSAAGAALSSDALTKASANLSCLASFQVRELTGALMAMVPAPGNKFAWAAVPTTARTTHWSPSPELLNHAIVPVGPDTAIAIGANGVWRLRLIRARHVVSGWQASWKQLGKLKTGIAGAAAVRVPGKQAICIVGSADPSMAFLRVLTWSFDTPKLEEVSRFRHLPSIRDASACTAGNLLVVFGGAKGVSHVACNDLHVIDMSCWAPVSVELADDSGPAPSGRWSHAASCSLGAAGTCMAVYGGTAGARKTGELLLGDMRVAELSGLEVDSKGNATSVTVRWREALIKDESARTSFRCAGLARTPARSFVLLRSPAASLTQGRLVMFGGVGMTPHGELPAPGFAAARYGPLRTTVAVRVGFAPVRVAGSTFSSDMATLLADALGVAVDAEARRAADGPAGPVADKASSGVLPEVELQPESGPLVRVHAALLFASAPSLRAAMLAACSRRASRVRFSPVKDEASGETHNQLIVTPVLDEAGGAVPLPELSGDYFVASAEAGDASAAPATDSRGEEAGELVRLVNWTALEGGPLVVPVDAKSAAVSQVVQFMYGRGGQVVPSQAADVALACEQLDLAPDEALSAAEELGWSWVGKAIPGKRDTDVAWASDDHGHRVAVDLRLFRAAAAAKSLERTSPVESARVPSSGDRTLRRSLGALLSGAPLARLQTFVAGCVSVEAGMGMGTDAASPAPRATAAAAAASAAGRGRDGDAEDGEGDEGLSATLAAERASELAYERSLRAMLPKWTDFWTLGADAAVRVGSGVLVPCHRAVLAVRSVFFRGAFACGMSEAEDGILSVGLEGLPAAAGLSLLAYLYSDAAPADIDPDLAVPLIRLATLHVLPRLRTRCEQAILEGFDFSDPESLAGLWEFAHCLGSVPRLMDVVVSGLHAFPSTIIMRAAKDIGVSPSLLSSLRGACSRV